MKEEGEDKDKDEDDDEDEDEDENEDEDGDEDEEEKRVSGWFPSVERFFDWREVRGDAGARYLVKRKKERRGAGGER